MKRYAQSFFIALLFSTNVVNAQYFPDFSWAGSTVSDDDNEGNFHIRDLILDEEHNVYMSGAFEDTVDIGMAGGGVTIFSDYDDRVGSLVAKYNQDGGLVWYSTFINDSHSNAWAIQLTNDNNMIVVGEYENTMDFDPGPDTYYLSAVAGGLEGAYDAYILKLDEFGGLVWAKTIGSPEKEHCADVAVDEEGNVYVLGYFQDAPVDFDPGDGEYVVDITGGGFKTFLLKLNADGEFQWVKTWGAPMTHCYGMHMDRDIDGNFLICGNFYGELDLDPGPGEVIATPFGGRDFFVLKLNESGEYLWSHVLGSEEVDEVHCEIETDIDGNVFFAGIIGQNGTYHPDEPVYDPIYGAIFLEKMDPDGNLLWFNPITRVEPYSCSYRVMDLSTDRFGNVYSSGGVIHRCDFDPSEEEEDIIISDDEYDRLVYKLDNDGDYKWALQVGNEEANLWGAMHTNSSGAIVFSGTYKGDIDLNPRAGVAPFSCDRGETFIVKLTQQYAGLNENESPGLLLYPNPSEGIVNLEIPNDQSTAKVQISNLMGQEIYTTSLENGKVMVNTEEWSPGVYVVSVDNGTHVFREQFVVQ